MDEKTLELNIGCELLSKKKALYSNCYIKAVSSRSERVVGYDFAINIPEESKIMYYQFKAPKKVDGNQYTFKINSGPHHDQHRTLLKFAMRNKFVYYVFPLIKDVDELREFNGNLSTRTAFVDVHNIRIDNNEIEHKIRIQTDFLEEANLDFIEIESEIENALIVEQLIQRIKEGKIGISKRDLNEIFFKFESILTINEKIRLYNCLRRGKFIIFHN